MIIKLCFKYAFPHLQIFLIWPYSFLGLKLFAQVACFFSFPSTLLQPQIGVRYSMLQYSYN